MPPIAVHFALGATAAWLVARRLKAPEDRGKAAFGFIAGAVLVDADLIVSSLAFLATGSVEPGKLIHRTLTHAFPFTLALALVGIALLRSPARRGWGVFALAFAASTTVLHILPDSLYLVGVKFLFPFTLESYHFGPFALERFTDTQNNVINGVDFALESAAWTWTWWVALRYGTENRLTRLLPALAVVNLVLYVALTAMFAARQDYDTFLVTIYVPGFANIVLSTVLIPLLARSTWEAFGRGPPAAKVKGRTWTMARASAKL